MLNERFWGRIPERSVCWFPPAPALSPAERPSDLTRAEQKGEMSRNMLGCLADKRGFIFPTQRPTKHPAQTGKGRVPPQNLVDCTIVDVCAFGVELTYP